MRNAFKLNLALILAACAGRATPTDEASRPVGVTSARVATLVGRVIDAETATPLRGMQVFLGGTAISVRTDSLGRYTLSEIPPGRYTVVAGHATRFTKTVVKSLRAGRVDTLDFRLRLNPGPIR